MKKSRTFSSAICIILSLLMVVDFTVFQPAPAMALDKKSVVVGVAAGAAVGAGVVLAAPAIAGAVGAAGGIAGIGTAVCGGVAAVGGGLLGALGAIGGAIGAAVGAIGGWIAGIIASPLFIPALIIIGAVAVGIFLYRRHKKKQQAAQEVIPGSDEIMVTPSDYDMSTVIPSMNQTGPVTIGDQDAVVISGTEAQVTDTAPVSDVTVGNTDGSTTTAAQTPTTTTTTTTTTSTSSSTTLNEAHARYIAAYNKYTQLATTAGGTAAEVKAALAEYRAAYQEYTVLKQTQNLK